MVEAEFNRNTLFTSKWNLHLRKKLVKCYIWNIAFCVAETWTLREVIQQCLGRFEMLYRRRMEEMSWTDRVRNKGILLTAMEDRNILRTTKRRNAN